MLRRKGRSSLGKAGRPPEVYEFIKPEGPTPAREKRTPPENELIGARSSSRQVSQRHTPRTQNHDINKVLDKLEDEGAELTRTSKSRVKIEVPGREGPVFVSNTPSDRHAIKNFKRDVKRVLGMDV